MTTRSPHSPAARRLFAVSAGTVAALVMAACGGGGDDASDEQSAPPAFSGNATGALSAWGFENADDVGTSRLDYAKSQLSGVDIKIDATAFDAQKFTTRAAGGDIPDVVQMDRRYVATYAAQGLIKPLDGCFSANNLDPSSTYYPSVVKDVTYDGHVWAVPQFFQPPAIIVNKRVMAEAGVTAEEIDTSKPDALLAAIEKMYKASGNNPTTLGFDPVATGQPELWILGFGGQLVDDQGKPTLDNPKNAEVLAMLKRIEDAQGGYAKVKSFTDSFDSFGDKNQYVTDKVGAQVNAQWYVNVLTPYVDKVDISAVPFRGADGQPFTTASGSSFVIPDKAKNPDAACQWAVKLTSQEAWLAAGKARDAKIKKTPGAINTGLFTGSPAADKEIQGSCKSSRTTPDSRRPSRRTTRSSSRAGRSALPRPASRSSLSCRTRSPRRSWGTKAPGGGVGRRADGGSSGPTTKWPRAHLRLRCGPAQPLRPWVAIPSMK